MAVVLCVCVQGHCEVALHLKAFVGVYLSCEGKTSGIISKAHRCLLLLPQMVWQTSQ